jgi:ferritin-like metal-binding protein YciE
MKTIIQSPQEALASQLQGLYYIESKVSDELTYCLDHITSSKIKNAINKYVSQRESKLLNLEHIFDYLMCDPLPHKNEVVMKMLAETYQMLAYKSSLHLKDMLIVSCIQNINSYKISAYRTAYLFAVEIEVDAVIDHLQQILESELEMEKELAVLAIKEFNEMEPVS